MQHAEPLTHEHGVAAVCAALGVPRSSLYRHRNGKTDKEPGPRPTPPRSLSQTEKDEVLDLLNSERFQDLAPREVYAILLDEGLYYSSWRTMYRILAVEAEVRERRNQLRHPVYSKPELMATGPKQVWSWDITKLRGPSKGIYYYLYVLLDIFSRYATGWMVAERESAELAQELIAETCAKQGIEPGTLTLHADNGPEMTSKPVAVLFSDLGITESHSRPYVSDDNPFSEAQFKTIKYHPDYPDRFESITCARTWGRKLFAWYNNEHHHTGLALLTPADVHWGRTETVLNHRRAVLQQAYEAHPERFVKGAPVLAEPPKAVYINPPQANSQAPQALAIKKPEPGGVSPS